MAGKESYCLRLKDFESNIRTTWQDLQSQSHFYDVTLGCEEKQIQAHRFLVASSSSVLQKILEHNTNPNPYIYLRGVKFKELSNLLTFIYQGEVKIDQDDLVAFMAVAQDLRIRGLYEKEEVLLAPDEYMTMDQQVQARNENVLDENIPNEGSQCLEFQTKEEPIDEKKYVVSKEDENESLTSKTLMKINGSSNSCNLSGRKFSSDTNLNNHKMSQHNDEYIFMDQSVQKSSENLSNENIPGQINPSFALIPKEEENEPMRTKALININSSSNFCDLCGKRFSSGANVYTHIMSAHKGVRYSCEKCPVKTTTKGNLKAHIESVHDGVRHSCTFCDITFACKSKLKLHIKRVHTGMYV